MSPRMTIMPPKGSTWIIQPKKTPKFIHFYSSSLGGGWPLPDHQAQEGDIGDFSALLEALQGAEAHATVGEVWSAPKGHHELNL